MATLKKSRRSKRTPDQDKFLKMKYRQKEIINKAGTLECIRTSNERVRVLTPSNDFEFVNMDRPRVVKANLTHLSEEEAYENGVAELWNEFHDLMEEMEKLGKKLGIKVEGYNVGPQYNPSPSLQETPKGSIPAGSPNSISSR